MRAALSLMLPVAFQKTLPAQAAVPTNVKTRAIVVVAFLLAVLVDAATSGGYAQVRTTSPPQISQTANNPGPSVAASARKKKDSVRKAWDNQDKCYRNCMAGGVRSDFCSASCY